MSMDHSDPLAPARDRPPPEPSLADLADAALRKIVTAIVIAGAIIAIAIYARPAPPRFQVAVGDGRIVRIDTRNGTVIACEGEHCAIVLKHGRRLERSLPTPAPAPAALPAPAAAPAPAPQPRQALPAPR